MWRQALHCEVFTQDKQNFATKSHYSGLLMPVSRMRLAIGRDGWRPSRQLRLMQSEVEEELAAEKVFLQGCDKFGRRILVLRVSKHSVSVRKIEQTMRNLCYSLDKAIALADAEKNPEGKIAGIFDLRGQSLFPVPTPVSKHQGTTWISILFPALRLLLTVCRTDNGQH